MDEEEEVEEVVEVEEGRFTPRRRRARVSRVCAVAHTDTDAHSHASPAQGLNFNYFLFGRYNISMLGGAWPTGLASRRHLCQVMLL